MERRPPEQPWNDWEKSELFCEVIKTSHVSPEDIFRVIQTHSIAPAWDQIVLPRGRTVEQCKRQFDFYTRTFPYTPRATTLAGPSQYPSAGPSYRAGPTDSRLLEGRQAGRFLLPKVAPPTPVEGGSLQPGSPLADQPPAKKRGRPPKEVVTQRKLEAEMRGETYPPPRTKRPKRASVPTGSVGMQMLSSASQPSPFTPQPPQTEAAPTQLPRMSTPTATTAIPPPEAMSSGSSSGKRKRRVSPPGRIDTTSLRTQQFTSYGSPPPTSYTQGYPSTSSTSGATETPVLMDRTEEGRSTGVPPTFPRPQHQPPISRSQSYRDIVGIESSSSRGPTGGGGGGGGSSGGGQSQGRD